MTVTAAALFTSPSSSKSNSPPLHAARQTHTDQTLANPLTETLTLTPAHLSLPRLLKACAKSTALSTGKQLHALSVKLRLSSDLYVQTSLLSMYSSCSQLHHALQVFDQMPHPNVVAWTAAIDACLRYDHPDAALSMFLQMQESGVTPDAFSLVSVLSACASLGALNLGRAAHAQIEKTGTELTAFVGTALLDMYCKCGSLEDAVTVFDSMPRRDRTVQSWNAMLHGLSVHGRGAEAVRLFSKMESDADGSLRPNKVTFVGLLCGCAHAGLVQEGKFYFDVMKRKYRIEPTEKHYGCMVDLLGRTGLLDEAFEMVEQMPVPPNHIVWGALLGACRVHKDLSMAERVMERIVEEAKLPVGDTSHYVIMSNMYRQAGLSAKMAEVRAKVGKKPRGRSWIEIGRCVHEFGVGCDASLHPMWGEIKEMLDNLEVKVGKEKKREDLEEGAQIHSEVVALAFGLISTSMPTPIRISKNLRICDNCHGLMKAVSEIYRREIVVRDCNRFHHFRGGQCSCNDFW